MAYWTLAVFPESFAPGTLPLTHKSVLVIRNESESMRVQGSAIQKFGFTFLQPRSATTKKRTGGGRMKRLTGID